MLNAGLLVVQIFVISWITFLCLKVGEKAVNAWLVTVVICFNLFVLKQVTLFGMELNTTKAIGVCYFLGLNLMQEYYGRKCAKTHVMIASLCTFGFVILQQIHMSFIPNHFDSTQEAYGRILGLMPSITAVSFITFITVQLWDIRFYAWLQKVLPEKRLTIRVMISLMASQVIDVCMFYGLMSIFEEIWGNIWDLIFFTLIVKFIVIFMIAPYTALAKLFIDKDAIARTQHQ